MVIQMKRFFHNHAGFLLRFGAIVAGLAFASEAMAGASAVSLTVISGNVTRGVKNISIMIQDVALITGVGFVMASFFKFHQHKLNPTQVPMSQGITLLAIGAGLAVFPHMLNTATTTVFGASVAKVGGSAIGQVVQS